VCTRGSDRAPACGPSTSPLEVTVYVRDPVALLGPSRWINRARLTCNVWFWAFFGTALYILLLNLFRVPRDSIFRTEVLWALVYGVFGSAVAVFPLWYGFALGLVKCPCCGERFARQPLSPFIRRRCVSCGYDIALRTRDGDF
jgi:hypothetical protein